MRHFGPASPPSIRPQGSTPEQVDEDLARLAPVTQCVRTYATDFGSEYVPEIARRYDLKVHPRDLAVGRA